MRGGLPTALHRDLHRVLGVCLFLGGVLARAATTNSFVNFETAPVHPLDLSPDGRWLAVAQLPAARVEVFDLSEGGLARACSIPVGLDPTSVRFRTSGELWVVNALSDSVSVVDVASRRVVATVEVPEGPSDLVFAGEPVRAVVSCSTANALAELDPAGRRVLRTTAVDGERPRALATSPDGRWVYVALFESGNATTSVGMPLGRLAETPGVGAVGSAMGPYAGLDPPPNVDGAFVPPVAPAIHGAPPRVAQIVRKDAAGVWRDDNGRDWTELVRGTNSALSGRRRGWDMPDRDVVMLDLHSGRVAEVRGLMNVCMGLAVNPRDGGIAVVGTDGRNEVRFEPRLRSGFHQVRLALIDPLKLASPVRLDLNPQLEGAAPTLPVAQRRQSLGDPRAVAWDAAGTRLYVAGMGSGNVIVLDRDGRRRGILGGFGEFPGPAGIVHDAPRGRLYLYQRFAGRLDAVDPESGRVLLSARLHDPTPAVIRTGRRLFYDTVKTSGQGQAACASCHVDGRTDRLAWDLGAPDGREKPLTGMNFVGSARPENGFHPMKGPMVTQTLVDIIGHEPLHWRGDREGLEEFNPTFQDLQGAEALLTAAELGEFKAFLATLTFPPNRLRNFDNSLPTQLPLPGHVALGRDALPRGAPLPPGNAVAGLRQFLGTATEASCAVCHTLPTGLGPGRRFAGGWIAVPPGTNGAARVASVVLGRSDVLSFKVPGLRTLRERMGFHLGAPSSRAGFGFMHDGRVDTLTRFLHDGFQFREDQGMADMIAFLLCLPGSDLPQASGRDANQPPGIGARDVPASCGRQVTVISGATNGLWDAAVLLAASPTGRVDVIVRGATGGVVRGWWFNRTSGRFEPDVPGGQALLPDALRGLATPSNPLTLTVVPRGSGRRLGVDQDEDGALDGEEIAAGSDPGDASSLPSGTATSPTQVREAVVAEDRLMVRWRAEPGRWYRVEASDSLESGHWRRFGEVTSADVESGFEVPVSAGFAERYFRVVQLP